MAYLQEIEQQMNVVMNQANRNAAQLGVPKGGAYASYYPTWEMQAPQYIIPNALSLANQGYRTNEFVYSIINKRGRAEGKGNLIVNDITKDSPAEVKNHPLVKLMRHPNQNVTEKMFWQMKRVSQDIAGFSAWEIEKDRMGRPLRLWFMRPDWCSFLRGPQQPMRAIRYQPYGLPYQDVPMIDEDGTAKVLFFSNGEDFDPIYPQIRFLSPTAHALRIIEVDNAMSFFLNDFVKHGAKFAGLLSVADTIDQNTADDYKRRWRDSHGGSDNWSDPLILGLGTTYSSMQLSMNDMAFPELDARTESRICNAFDISPIVAEARAGLNVSTYNNKKEAYKDWYQDWVTDTWEEDAQILTNQMLPLFGIDPNDMTFACSFDTSTVYALSEDRDAKVKRASIMYKDRIARLNEARAEMNLDPINEKDPSGKDMGNSFYAAVTVRAPDNVNAEGEVTGAAPVPGGPTPTAIPTENKSSFDFAADEVKTFRKFAAHYRNDPAKLVEFEFKHLSKEDQSILKKAYGAPDNDTLQLVAAVNKLADQLCQPVE